MRRTSCLALIVVTLFAACASPSVYVVRHAQAYSNLRPKPDLPAEQLDSLTPLGVEQAQALAQELRRSEATLVLHSPKGRTRQTAEIIARVLGVPTLVAPELAPLAGAWDGREAGWAAGEDLRPTDGESMADGVQRALTLIRRYSEESIVVVTHSDIAAALIGEAAGTPVSSRYAKHKPGTGTSTPIPGLSLR